MAINLKLKSGINENSVKYKELLSNLQSNILKGHNRKYVKLIFLQFFGSQQEVKNWISKLNVTSAMKQVEDSNIRRSDTGSDTDYDGGLIKNFFLTAEGYEELGFETQKFRKNGNRIFLKGMKSKRARRALNDPPVENWQDDYSEDIDAMILLADKKSSVLDAEVEEIRNEIETFAQVVIIESGNKLSDDKEHFGYVDGISNPKYYKRDAEKEATKRGGINKNNPIRPLSEILIKDPFGKRGLDHFGSFFVYRKLSQNVKGFNKKVKALGKMLS